MVDNAVQVFEQIQRAVRTLRKLPPAFVRSSSCSWPEIVRSFHEAYGYNDPTPPRLVPTARQITEMDQVIGWIAFLANYGEEYPRIIWARAEKASWRKIATLVGLSKDTCRERFRVGIYGLFYAIESRKVK